MRRTTGLKAALFGGAVTLVLSAGRLHAQTVGNPNFELPADGASGTDTVATPWTLDPAVGDDYTNPGQRCQFDTPTPSGGTWSLWLQTFVQSGDAQQVVTGITPGTNYALSAQMGFQDGSAAGQGYNAVTQANQAGDPNTKVTGDLYSYLEIQYESHNGTAIGAPDILQIPAGSVGVYNGSNGATPWIPYSVSGIAPAGATQADVVIGWQNGGLDGNTGGQSAFATSVGLTAVVPEPATLSMLAIGSLALFARRRAKSSV
jgi:hypothetical protein